MLVYHGSTVPVEEPRLIPPVRTLDFGPGFYVTTNLAQARAWARIKAKRDLEEYFFVSIFGLDEEIFNTPNKKVKVFGHPDKNWLEFILANRKKSGYRHSFEVVRGPVANDRVYTCLNAYENGFMDFDTVLKELKASVLVDQISFHTETALDKLQFKTAKEYKK